MRDRACTECQQTHLEDTVRLNRVDPNLGQVSRPRKLAQVLRAGCPRPQSRVHRLEGSQRRGLQTLRDVDLLEDLPEDSEVVGQGFAIRCTTQTKWSAYSLCIRDPHRGSKCPTVEQYERGASSTRAERKTRTSQHGARLLAQGPKEPLSGLKRLAEGLLRGSEGLLSLFLHLLCTGGGRREALLLQTRVGVGDAAGADGLRHAGGDGAHHGEEGARTRGMRRRSRTLLAVTRPSAGTVTTSPDRNLLTPRLFPELFPPRVRVSLSLLVARAVAAVLPYTCSFASPGPSSLIIQGVMPR